LYSDLLIERYIVNHHVFTLLLLIPFVLTAQFCEQIPTSLSEAELFLESGEIDSVCFEQFRELLLNPVYPRREGWRKIRVLAFELDGMTFPSPAQLTEIPDSIAKIELANRYPWLEPYLPLIEFDQPKTPSPVQGLLTGKISATDSMITDSRGRVVLTGMQNGSFMELSLEEKESQLIPIRRELTGRLGSIGGELSLGNFQVEKRSLLWGDFTSSSSITDVSEQILYGKSSTWNGISGAITRGNLAVESFVHHRKAESMEYGSVLIRSKRIEPKIGIIHQIHDSELWIGSVVLNDSNDRFRVETNLTSEGERAISVSTNLHVEKVYSTTEIWAISSNYLPQFSSRIGSLQGKYDTPGSAMGMVSRWNFRGILFRTETRFSGEICDQGGSSDIAISVSSPKILNSSIRNRYSITRNENYTEHFYESAIKTVPHSKRFSFPLATETRLNESGWDKTSVHLGSSFNGISVKPEMIVSHRFSVDENQKTDLRMAIVQRFKSKGSSSCAVTIPLNNERGVSLYGKATFLF